AKVGKTTLILSLVSEEFSPKVPAQAEEITIPADVTPERVATQIVDYSSRTQSQEQLCAEIRRADVICLVHALDDEKSLEKLSSFWLPLIRHNNPNSNSHIPIVLVGNKLDLLNESQLSQVLPIMSEFSEVETCIECSAKTLLNLSEAFWFAQKAVLYPTAPLYDAERKEVILLQHLSTLPSPHFSRLHTVVLLWMVSVDLGKYRCAFCPMIAR
ncbi:hypothetical protein P879_10158, partial [Paragonimus westermani]